MRQRVRDFIGLLRLYRRCMPLPQAARTAWRGAGRK